MELEEERTKLTKTGFVTFKTICKRVGAPLFMAFVAPFFFLCVCSARAFQVQQTLLERRTFKFKVEPASTARDIIWKNLNIDDKMFWGRSIVVNAVVFFLIFFWSTPIGLVTSLVQLKSLARLFRNTFGWTAAGDFIDDIPDWLAGPLSSYLPIILLAVFLAIVPMLLELLARAQGLRSSSSVETAVVERCAMATCFGLGVLTRCLGRLLVHCGQCYFGGDAGWRNGANLFVFSRDCGESANHCRFVGIGSSSTGGWVCVESFMLKAFCCCALTRPQCIGVFLYILLGPSGDGHVGNIIVASRPSDCWIDQEEISGKVGQRTIGCISTSNPK